MYLKSIFKGKFVQESRQKKLNLLFKHFNDTQFLLTFQDFIDLEIFFRVKGIGQHLYVY